MREELPSGFPRTCKNIVILQWGNLFFYGIAVIFHAPDDCQGSFSLASQRFLIKSVLLSTCLFASVSQVMFASVPRANLKAVCLSWLVPSIVRPGMR